MPEETPFVVSSSAQPLHDGAALDPAGLRSEDVPAGAAETTVAGHVADQGPDPGATLTRGTRGRTELSEARLCRRRRAIRMRNVWSVLRGGFALAALLTAGLLLYSWIGMAAAIRVVNQQAEAIRDGRIDDAYQLFSSDYRLTNTLAMFRDWVERHEEFSRAQNMHIWSRAMRSQSAVLWGLVEDYRGQRYPVRYQLIREQGQWRINEVQMRRSWAEESIDEMPRASFI